VFCRFSCEKKEIETKLIYIENLRKHDIFENGGCAGYFHISFVF
jgi:hypothetical protein